MVDDVRDFTETAESKASAEALDRSRLARERREAEQRKRLDELRAHAAAAQAQREKRDEDRRKRQAEARAKDDERRVQVEERKRAIWEASISRREALLQRERDRTERLERQRATRSAPRPAFAFGSSTPRLLEPVDSAGFFWAARSTNPIDQMNFFESLAASTTNVMFASAPLTRRASALHLDASDTDNKDEPERTPPPLVWSSVARRRTDLVPTLPAPRAPGRAYSMTRLDRLPPAGAAPRLHSASPSMHHLSVTQTRSGDTTPGSRPGSALSNAASVVRRPTSGPRKPRPASIAGTGVNTPRGGGDTGAGSVATTPSVSRDSTVVAGGAAGGAAGGGGDAPRRHTTPRRPRPLSVHSTTKPSPPVAPGEGKPPLHRKPKPAKEHDKSGRGKSQSASPGRALSPSPPACKEPGPDKHIAKPAVPVATVGKSQVNAVEVTQKLEALQIHNGDPIVLQTHDKVIENKETLEIKQETKIEDTKTEIVSNEQEKPSEVQKPVEKREEIREERREEKKESSVEKTEENEMTASMTARRITTEEQAKAALAERRRRAREELERQAELERQRLQLEAEEEAERQRQEEERQRREEEEARELAQLQRRMEEEKLRKAIEAQQQLERDEAERKVREEADKQARLKEDEEKRKAAEEAEKLRKEEAEREEKERLARKQRVEAIMARTRLRKAEEDKKAGDGKAQTAPIQEPASQPAPDAAATDNSTTPALVETATEVTTATTTEVSIPVTTEVADSPATLTKEVPSAPSLATEVASPAPTDNGNSVQVADLLDFSSMQSVEPAASGPTPAPTNNGNMSANPFAVSTIQNTEDKPEQTATKQNLPTNDNSPTPETNNGNVHANVGHISANFLQTERLSNESQKMDVPKLLDDDFTTHNGHGAHPLTLQNAI